MNKRSFYHHYMFIDLSHSVFRQHSLLDEIEHVNAFSHRLSDYVDGKYVSDFRIGKATIIFKTEFVQYGFDFTEFPCLLFTNPCEEFYKKEDSDTPRAVELWEEYVSEVQESFDHFISYCEGVFFGKCKDSHSGIKLYSNDFPYKMK